VTIAWIWVVIIAPDRSFHQLMATDSIEPELSESTKENPISGIDD